jgi:predicted enzyme related to lactoylglutathione lyase/heme-degrading monooxygenase HmoA
MHIQIVTFKLYGITEAEYIHACEEQFAPAFRNMAGLISKVWLRNAETNTYGGVYTWRDKTAMDAYMASDVFRSAQQYPHFAEVTSRDYGVIEGITTGAAYPDPFGFAAVAQDLQAAKEFYQRFYPYQVIEGTFGGIRYISIMKDGATLVNVFEKSHVNPIRGTIPILKVASVTQSVRTLEESGGSVVIPAATCPCTDTTFAVCADPGGNQLMFKEAAR